MSRNTVKLCNNCKSEIITVKRDSHLSVECAYCGSPYDDSFDLNDFESELDGDY